MRSLVSNASPPKGGLVYEPEPLWLGDVPVHETYNEARAGLIDSEMCRSRKYQEMQWRALRIGTHPDIVDFSRFFCAKLKKLNMPFYAFEFVRTPQRQKELYEKGVSKAVGVKAPHPYGCAVDIVHCTRLWTLSQKQWELIGALGKELAIQRGLDLTWGGDWPPLKEKVGWDPAHWQLKAWRQQMSGFPFMPRNER